MNVDQTNREQINEMIDILAEEGLAGKTYRLRLINPEFISGVEGAKIERDQLIIRIPCDRSGKFVAHAIRINYGM